VNRQSKIENRKSPELPEPPDLRPTLPPHPARAADEEPNLYHRMGIAYTVPAALVAPIIALIVIGAWLDKRFGLGPWGTLGGALLGFVCGMINMIRIASRLNR
jgi:F0F1-type ATP synthase assembly protein I